VIVTAASATTEIVMFWVFGVMALGSALAVISLRNIVHGALMLVVNLLAIAGLYLTLESSFLSIIQVLVYAGAIMVLFLFVIMLLGVDRDDLLVSKGLRTKVLAIAGAAVLSGALLLAFVGPYTGEAAVCGNDIASSTGQVNCRGLAEVLGDDTSGVAFLGMRLFTRYTLSFELAALLLTVATIGAVILARRNDLEPEDLDTDPQGSPDDGDLDPDAVSAADTALIVADAALDGQGSGDKSPGDRTRRDGTDAAQSRED